MRNIVVHTAGRVFRIVRDAGNFEESKHPRAENGQFGSGSTSSGSTKELGGGLKAHPENKMREYTPKELDWEYEVEYLKYSKPVFPDAFSSREDFQKKYDDAPLVHLTDKELSSLGNSMAYSGKNRGEEWVHKTFSHRRDSKRIINEMKNEKTAPPIVLKKGGKLRLMAGQTRLATGLALGMSVPAKVITIDGTKDEAPWEESKHPRAKNGQFGSGGSGSSSPATAEQKHAEMVYKATSAPTKGTTAERIALRKLLKEPGLPNKYKAEIKDKILQSFLVQHVAVTKKGDHTKAAELMGKMQKLGYKPPVPTTVAQANVGYTPQQQAAAQTVMKATLPAPASGGTFSPQDTADFNDLVSFIGMDKAKNYSILAKNKLAANPDIKLSVGEAAHINAYSGHAYHKSNDALRAGVMNEATWKHVNSLNKALDKLPKYRGTTYRKVDIGEKQLELYQPGMIVEERGFTSTSTNSSVWSGNVQYEIKGKSGRDIQALSNSPGEQEVLFKSGTRFKINKVDKKLDSYGGTTAKIYMEEVGDD